MDEKQIDMLVENSQNGDKQAFAGLYRQFVGSIYAYYYVRLGTRYDSEDLASKVFIKALKGINGFKKKSSFKTWLYAIAKNELMDFFRKKKVIAPFCEDSYFVEESDDPYKIQEQKQIDVEKMLDMLPGKFSQVLRLRFMQGLSVSETAQVLGISENNVKVRQLRALKKARSLNIKEQYE